MSQYVRVVHHKGREKMIVIPGKDDMLRIIGSEGKLWENPSTLPSSQWTTSPGSKVSLQYPRTQAFKYPKIVKHIDVKIKTSERIIKARNCLGSGHSRVNVYASVWKVYCKAVCTPKTVPMDPSDAFSCII